MAVFTIQTPEGKKLKIEAADEETAIKGAQEWSAQNAPKATAKTDAPQAGGVGDLVRQGIGLESGGLAQARQKAKAGSDFRTTLPDILPRGQGGVNFTSQLTAPFNDEIAGAVGFLAQGGSNLLRRARGLPVQIKAGDAYTAERDQAAEDQAAYAKAHPGRSIGGQLLGGLATGPGQAVGLIPTLANIGGTGAVYGAAGDNENRVRGAATGAGMALATAGALKGASKLASPAVRGLVNAIADRRAPVPAGAPQDITARTALQAARFVRNVAQSAGKDPAALTGAEFAGKNVTAAEAIGRPGVTHLSALSRRAGTTPDIAEAHFGERAAETGNRLLDDIANATGVHPEAARGDVEAIVAAGQKRAGPMFDKALASPDPLINPELALLAKRPVIARALKDVAQDILNEGGDPQAVGLVVKGVDPNGMPDMVELKAPTAKTWDLVKKATGRQVERNPVTNKPLPDSASKGNYGVGVATRDLTQALRKHIPGYGEALDASGDYLTIDSAFNRVKGKLFSTKTTPVDFSKLWGSLKTGGDQGAAQSAIASDLFDRAQNGQLKPGALRVPAVRAKLQAAFGKDQVEAITKAIEAETKMSAYGGRIRPGNGSQTGELKAAMQEQDGQNPAGEAVGDFMRGVIGRRGVFDSAVGATLRQIGKAGATLRAPGMAVPIRDEAGRLLMMSPEELSAYLASILKPRAPLPPVSVGVSGAAPAALQGQLQANKR